MLKKEKIPILITIMVLGSILSPSVIHISHAATGEVCLADPSVSPCPSAPAVFAGPVGQEIKIGVFVSGSDGMDGFDITLLTNHSILTPIGVDLTGSILIGSPVIVVECFSGLLLAGSTCSATDTIDTIHLAATSALGSPLTGVPTTGLLFTAIYNITGTNSPSNVKAVGFQSGCTATSILNTCVTIANGSPAPDSETVQTGTTFNNSASPSMAQIFLSANIRSFGPQFPGTANTALVNATAKNGFPGTATDSVSFTSTASSGLSVTITGTNPCVTNGSSCAVTVGLNANSAGNFVATILGTYSTIDSSGNPDTLVSVVTISVVATDFSFSIGSTTLSFASGSAGTDALMIGSQNGFAGVVAFTASVITPAGLTVTFTPPSVTLAPGLSTIANATFRASPSTTTIYHVRITATSGSRVKNSPLVTVTVNVSGPDFAISANPTVISVPPQVTGSSTITVSPLGGFKGLVALSDVITPASGLTCSLNPTQINTTGTSSLGCNGSSQGTFSVVVTGTSGTLSHSVTVSIVVALPQTADFAISADPTLVNTPAGANASSTITVSRVGNFTGTVDLFPQIPAGLSCILNPIIISISGTSLLSCRGSAGTYSVSVTGSSGSLSHSVTIVFQVTAGSAGIVCIAKDGSTSCPLVPPILTSSTSLPTSIRVAVVVNSSLGLDGFDITLVANHTILKPWKVDLTNSVLIAPPTILLECFSGVLVIGSTCSSTDTIDTLHLVAVSPLGSALTTAPTTGLLFTAIYNVTASSAGTPIGFQTGCSFTSLPDGTCVTIANGTPSPDGESVQAASFTDTSTFWLQAYSSHSGRSASVVEVSSGSSDSSTILNVTSINGFAATVTLTGSFAPAGPTATISPGSVVVNATVSSSLTSLILSAGSSVHPGTYTLTIIANGGGASRSLIITVVVIGPNFSMSITPPELAFDAGQSSQATVTVSSIAGFSGAITFTATVSSTGLGLSTLQGLLLKSGGTNSSTLFITTNNSTLAGTYTIAITATNGTLSHSVILTVNIADFGLVIEPLKVTLQPGVAGDFSIQLVSQNGFSGTVSLAASQLPQLTAAFGGFQTIVVAITPGTIHQFILTVTAGTNILPGNYTVTLTGTGPFTVHSGKIQVFIIAPAKDFIISALASQLNIQQGGGANDTIFLTSVNGFRGNLTLSVVAFPGIIATLSGSNVTLVGFSTDNLSVQVPQQTQPGFYSITVFATNGNLTHTVSVTVDVIAPPRPDFAISANPSFLFLNAGNSGNSTLTVVSLGGFRGNLTLGDQLVPISGVSISIQPTSITLAANGFQLATLSISTSRTSPVGTFTITVTVSNSTSTRITYVTLQIAPPPDVPPVANFTFTPSTPIVGHDVLFNGTSSFDPDGTVQLWIWNFGDGSGFYIVPSPLIDHTFFSPGNYSVTLRVQDNAGMTGSKTETVNVIARPAHDVSILQIFLSNNVAVSSQKVFIEVLFTNDGTSDENVSLTVYANNHPIKTLTGLFIQACNLQVGQCFIEYFVIVTWDTTGVVPGDYTISATIFLPSGETDPTPQDNSFTDGTITILPPPVITATPGSGTDGTKVTVRGSGFPLPSGNIFGPSFSIIDVTFDDMNLGFVLTTNGTFTFTLDVPLAQSGPHTIKAFDEVTGAHTSTGFQVLPNPGTIVVSIDTGAVYFPGDTATVYILTTQNGTPVGPTGLQVQLNLVYPNGTLRALQTISVSTGLYKATYKIPTKNSLGTYSLVASVHMTGASDGSALAGFEVKPSWLASNSSTIAGATTVAGVLGFAGLAWKKGYFRRKEDDVEGTKEVSI